MSHINSDRAIILKKMPYGEADEIVTALTKEHGVVRFFATSSKKSTKRFGANLDVFSPLEIQYSRRGEGMARLDRIEVDNDALLARFWENDLLAYAFLQYAAELIMEFVPENSPSSEPAFVLWCDFLQHHSKREFNAASALEFLEHFMVLSGYANTSPVIPDGKKAIKDSLHDTARTIRHILQKCPRSEQFFFDLLEK